LILEERKAGKAGKVNQRTDVSRLRLPLRRAKEVGGQQQQEQQNQGGKKIFALVTSGGFLRKDWQRANVLKNRQGK
jgi:hypothetical protein